MKKAFTIIELLVAMGLLSMLIAISGLVFSTAVKAHRVADATGEIATKLQAITQQLDADFGKGHLQKDGEVLFVSMVEPEYAVKDGQFVDINTTVNGVITSPNKDGNVPDAVDEDGNGIPDRYLPFDRIMFFTTGDFQSYNAQQTNVDKNNDGVLDTKIIYSNMARVCYSFGKNAQGTQAAREPSPSKRIFCRTQHLITADTDLPAFPVVSSWSQSVADTFNTYNFKYEYQTMMKENWFAMTDAASPDWQAKIDMLFYIVFDTPINITLNSVSYSPSSWCHDGDSQLKVDLSAPDATVHQLFMQGVGQFHVQIWQWDPAIGRYRWWPEIDPDGDGIYNEGATFNDGRTDYNLDGNAIDISTILGKWYPAFGAVFDNVIGPALKFTFTLYDSNGVFKDGKTFTYIVNLQ